MNTICITPASPFLSTSECFSFLEWVSSTTCWWHGNHLPSFPTTPSEAFSMMWHIPSVLQCDISKMYISTFRLNTEKHKGGGSPVSTVQAHHLDLFCKHIKQHTKRFTLKDAIRIHFLNKWRMSHINEYRQVKWGTWSPCECKIEYLCQTIKLIIFMNVLFTFPLQNPSSSWELK